MWAECLGCLCTRTIARVGKPGHMPVISGCRHQGGDAQAGCSSHDLRSIERARGEGQQVDPTVGSVVSVQNRGRNGHGSLRGACS